MHVGLITAKEKVEIQEFDNPTPPPGGVVVDISYCGICGTDVHAYKSGDPYPPSVCGHEWAGTVSRICNSAKGFKEGDRVVVGVPPSCGKCDACYAGNYRYCLTTFLVARGRDELAPNHGGFAPHIPVGTNRLIKTNSELTDIQAAQVEPTTIALHAVNRTSPELGITALIIGAGPIGLIVQQWANICGANQTIVIEPSKIRRELAQKTGATITATPDNSVEIVNEYTRGLGADAVFECAGLPGTIQTSVDLCRRGGKVCLVGLSNELATINPGIWLKKEVTVVTSMAYLHDEFEVAMGMIADGRISVDSMHSSTVGLSDLDGALTELGDSNTNQTKILVDPNK